MKISHTNHSYLSPSKLNSIASVKALLSPTNTDDDDDQRTSSFTPTDLNKLIIDQSDTLSNHCNDDETNDNLSMSAISYKAISTTTTTTVLPSSPSPPLPPPSATETVPATTPPDTLPTYLLARNDNSLDFLQYNGSMDIDDTLPALSTATPKSPTVFRFSSSIDYSSIDVPTTPRSLTGSFGSNGGGGIVVGGGSGSGSGSGSGVDSSSILSALKPTTPDFLATDISHLNRSQNVDDLLSFTATTNTTATSSTLNSWNEANFELRRKGIIQSSSCDDDDEVDGDAGGARRYGRARRPFLSTVNRFLSLSISPPLARRQDMPVLRGTFVSLYVWYDL